MNELLETGPATVPAAAEVIRRLLPHRDEAVRQRDLARQAWAAGDPTAGAELAGPTPGWFFFLALASWADEAAGNEPAAQRLCEALLARFAVADVRADWAEPARAVVYGAGWLAGRHDLFPLPVEPLLVAAHPLGAGFVSQAARTATDRAVEDGLPRLGLATLNVLYALSPRAVGPVAESGLGAQAGRPRSRPLRAALLLMAIELLEWLAIGGEPGVFDTTRRLLDEAGALARAILLDPEALPPERDEAAGLLARAADRRATHSRTEPDVGLARLQESLALLPRGSDASTDRGRRRGGEREILLRVRLADLALRDQQFDTATEHLDRAAALLAEGDVDPELTHGVAHHRAILACLNGDFDAAEDALS